jgi:hypothetical protein
VWIATYATLGTVPEVNHSKVEWNNASNNRRQGSYLHTRAFVSVTGLVRFLVLFDFSNHGAPPFLPISDPSPPPPTGVLFQPPPASAVPVRRCLQQIMHGSIFFFNTSFLFLCPVCMLLTDVGHAPSRMDTDVSGEEPFNHQVIIGLSYAIQPSGHHWIVA